MTTSSLGDLGESFGRIQLGGALLVLGPYTSLPTGGYPAAVVRTGGYQDDQLTFGFPAALHASGRPPHARTGGRSDSET